MVQIARNVDERILDVWWLNVVESFEEVYAITGKPVTVERRKGQTSDVPNNILLHPATRRYII